MGVRFPRGAPNGLVRGTFYDVSRSNSGPLLTVAHGDAPLALSWPRQPASPLPSACKHSAAPPTTTTAQPRPHIGQSRSHAGSRLEARTWTNAWTAWILYSSATSFDGLLHKSSVDFVKVEQIVARALASFSGSRSALATLRHDSSASRDRRRDCDSKIESIPRDDTDANPWQGASQKIGDVPPSALRNSRTSP